MTLRALAVLLRLRYRLLWAHVRSRNGRILLAATLLLAVGIVSLLFALGGIGAAAAAVRLGKAEQAGVVALSALLLGSVVAAVLLGTNVGPAFSGQALRRYPLTRADRFTAQRVAVFLEPLWIVVFATTLGIAAGLSTAGAGLWFALAAAMLFVAVASLIASLVMSLLVRILSRRGGSLLVMILAMVFLFSAPAALISLARFGVPSGLIGTALGLTPPLLAARAMTTPSSAAASLWVVVLAAWVLVVALLVFAEARLARGSPFPARAIGPLRRNISDNIARLFGPRMAPLAAKMLRYMGRSPHFRFNFPLVLPVVMAMMWRRDEPLLFILGVAPAGAFLATGALTMNFFGFDGHGFRRYFLLPVAARDVFRTAALVSLIPGSVLIGVGLIGWFAFAPPHLDGKMSVLLASAAVGGLLIFHATGLWVTLVSPRRIALDATFGNKLSPLANALMIGSMVAFFGLPMGLSALGTDVVAAHWYLGPVVAAAGAIAFAATLRLGPSALTRRRERMLALVEKP